MTTFEKLAAIDCSKHVEKKGKFSYLSWPFAVRMLRENAPDATWEVKRFGEDRAPYQVTTAGVFVEVSVTVDGITLSQIHPVLNAANRPIAEPTAFDINTSIQRALVKAIALHGLGLYIYAGEDLPQVAENNPEPGDPHQQDIGPGMSSARPNTATQVAVDALAAMSDEEQKFLREYANSVIDLFNAQGDVIGYLGRNPLDNEEKLAVWSLLPSNVRSAIKKAQKEAQPPHLEKAA